MRISFASLWREVPALLFFLLFFVSSAAARQGDEVDLLVEHDPVYKPENQDAFSPLYPNDPLPGLTESVTHGDIPRYTPSTVANALQELHNALETMQTEYFALWLGKWVDAIDWTAAVIGTHLSATLSSLSHSLTYTMPGTFDKARKLDVEAQRVENEINKYFGQTITYYFGEDYFAIRNQAFDDILWVVLGWLESIQFINAHSDNHYPPSSEGSNGESEWHGRQFIPAFAHRARVFYELSEKGWDWRLCGGGMTWNPRLEPYKNAITNELFISASASMYLNFPGDDNCSPFVSSKGAETKSCTFTSSGPTYNPIYLANAINGYEWLQNSGMMNRLGLYTDGFHIKDYKYNRSKTECNVRNEMVYTYNQGVLLSGLRNLWEGTGNLTYLTDAHKLVASVIRATGWSSPDIIPIPFSTPNPNSQTHALPNDGLHLKEYWSGLGSNGILTELCDPSSTCSQDGQTFKSIFFHHLTTLCAPLPTHPTRQGKTHAASREIAALHARSCDKYLPWVIHNARAALRTRDAKGRFGAWWGAGEGNERGRELVPERAVDYRNMRRGEDVEGLFEEREQEDEERRRVRYSTMGRERTRGDPNARGRGRTVETQAGGVAVVRAMWEFLRRYSGEEGVGE
ncbi:Six-hairpin glycosidase [Corynespora cassiicola Philippines]|uniref:Six-hairpin glycosidase n=1 Tax=Corynespora cassiicola Philippines TaxID=1448308 RepID=A0A2T2NIL2_CORCC|nr:Six-hairpin glycosidase [Corynespora cassiicola Philippines]